MKRCLSLLLVVLLLLSCVVFVPRAEAAQRDSEARAIAIVFDNSGSMYHRGQMAWCRATYAMEVFASMLNPGDVLDIYPMNEIQVGENGTEKYDMNKPLRISSASEAKTIREIYTIGDVLTPVESVDAAGEGLKAVKADKKYLIVISDGEEFYRNKSKLSASESRSELDSRFQALLESGLDVMYLGIGKNVIMPSLPQSEHFAKEKAADSKDTLTCLTRLCNRVFGRDALPDIMPTTDTVKFDISMNKLIVFVQGEGVADVKLTGPNGPVGKQQSSYSPHYATLGTSRYKSDSAYTPTPDKTLQGMMITYADCPAGEYKLTYSGTATSVDVYYEPNADLQFVFTDDFGGEVDPTALYEGKYKISYGMMDGRTGKLIESELLGNPVYNGAYIINEKSEPIQKEGYRGEQEVALKKGDTFKANLQVVYLNGYKISKDETDFGWGEGGIVVASRPAGMLNLKISGGQEKYSLQNLMEGKPYQVQVFYDGQQLTGDALESVDLYWEPEKSNADIRKEFCQDHWKLVLCYKDPDQPQNTRCGGCTVDIMAEYTAPGSDPAQGSQSLGYHIEDDFSPLKLSMTVKEDYIVISDLGKTPPITVELTMNGAMLTAEEFARAKLSVDTGGIKHTFTPNPEDSSYTLQLQDSPGIAEGDYELRVTASYEDNIGRVTGVKTSAPVTLSGLPLWVKWVIFLVVLLLLIFIIYRILHIRVMPKYCRTTKRDSNVSFDGEEVTEHATYKTKATKGNFSTSITYGGSAVGLTMEANPGKESYLYKKQPRRTMEIRSDSVRKSGMATIQEASIGGVRYILNEDNGALERVPPNKKPILLRNGAPITYSGTMYSGGVQKSFAVTTKLNYRKK